MLGNTRTFTSFAVDDVPQALKFYGDTLGLKVSDEADVFFVHLPDGHPILVYPKPGHTPASYTVLNFEVADVDAAMEDLVARGARFLRFDGLGADEKGIVRGPHRDIAWFADPAGNIHSVFRSKTPLPLGDA